MSNAATLPEQAEPLLLCRRLLLSLADGRPRHLLDKP
jgi:hypothetical protein